MIMVSKMCIENKDGEIFLEENIPDWKVSLSKQLYQCIKDEYSSEIISKFENVKRVNLLCKKVSKSVLNCIYEEEILEAIADTFEISNISELDDDMKLKVSKKLKKCFLKEELEFLRDEVCDSISRLRKEWLNI